MGLELIPVYPSDMITLFPLAPRLWAVLSLVLAFGIAGSWWCMGEDAKQDMSREWDIVAQQVENRAAMRNLEAVTNRLDQEALLTEWLIEECTEQRVLLKRHGIRLHQSPL